MMQSGAPMVRPDFSGADFDHNNPAPLAFYAKFANPKEKTLYTWNDGFRNALDGFAEGLVDMMFGYGYQAAAVREKNPFLKFVVAPLPQPEQAQNPLTYANYWGFAVANTSRAQTASWNFIRAFAASAGPMKSYAEKTNRLPALRALIGARLSDPVWGVFAAQALYARSWPQVDNTAIDEIFSNMIADVVGGKATAEKALSAAEQAVSRLMAKKQGRL